MTNIIRKLAVASVALSMAICLLSCAGYNVPSTAPIPTTAPAADVARIWFVKPGGSLDKAEAFVFQGEEVIGYLQNRQMFYVEVPAGKYIFMSVTSNASGVEANVAGGKTYYIKLVSAPSAASILVGGSENLFMAPLKPGDDQWDDRHEWINKCRLMDLNHEKVGAWEEKYAERNAKRLAAFESGESEMKILAPEDGE